ncbi:MAG TPA: PIN domain-containing protein [Isosphaeraceae bacterium]|nr:PIN domain-containing protein [Isosphaeraceae bacterium]
MARIIVLDSGPLGLACQGPNKPEVRTITRWRIRAWANGALLVIPEIADYEVRRELLRAGAMAGVRRLDALRDELAYAPITTEAMRKAAELWAGARRRGVPTASDDRLDADAIVAAQALLYVGHGDDLTVATDNVRHLSRFLDAQPWEAITP